MPGNGAAAGASYGDLLVTSLLVLGAVCIAAFVAVRVFGRVLATGRAKGRHLLDVVARVPLEPRRSLYVVEVAGKTLLVGTSEMGLSVLSELDAGEVKSRVQPQPSFGELVRAAWLRRKNRGVADNAHVGTAPEARTDADVGTTPDARTDVDVGTPDARPDAHVGTTLDARTDADVGTPNARPDAHVGTTPNARPGAHVGTTPDARTDADVGTTPEARSGNAVRASAAPSAARVDVGEARRSASDT